MAISENQFFELEKRILSFKYSLGVANMTSEKKVLNEKYAKDTAVYPTNILTEGDSIKFNASSGDNNIKPSLLRTWVTSSEGGLTDEQRLLRGHFSSSIPDEADGTNPHVEKIIMPLTSVGGTGGQAYITYNKESQSLADSTNNYQIIEDENELKKNQSPKNYKKELLKLKNIKLPLGIEILFDFNSTLASLATWVNIKFRSNKEIKEILSKFDIDSESYLSKLTTISVSRLKEAWELNSNSELPQDLETLLISYKERYVIAKNLYKDKYKRSYGYAKKHLF